jgi:hypothetical protein
MSQSKLAKTFLRRNFEMANFKDEKWLSMSAGGLFGNQRQASLELAISFEKGGNPLVGSCSLPPFNQTCETIPPTYPAKLFAKTG